MSYKKFNKYIYKHFFKQENIGEVIIMVVDETFMSRFYEECEVKEYDLISDFKRIFVRSHSSVKEQREIPYFIGFVALQIYVAYLMHSDGIYTSNAYRPRLAEFIGIDEGYELKRFFELYQDQAWQALREWSEINGFILHIPEQDDLPWNRRYVSYPLSQALLNQEDLKKIPLLFENAGIKPDEYLYFDEFAKLIKGSDENIGLPNHYYRVKTRLQEQGKEDLLFQQIYRFFNNEWDGSYPEKFKRNTSQNKIFDKTRNFLIVDKYLKEVKVLNNDYECIYEYSLKYCDWFNGLNKYYSHYHKNLLLFIKDNSYDEWIDCRYMELNSEHLIICKNYTKPERFITHLYDECETISKNRDISIFKIATGNKLPKHHFWKDFFRKQTKNYFFENGLKLSRKTWMLGAGPTIHFTEKTEAWINGEKIIIENDNLIFTCINYTEGTYRLKVKDLPPERFYIKKPDEITNITQSGWQIDKKNNLWTHDSKNFQVSGLTMKFSPKTENANVKTWINSLSKQASINTKQNSSIVIKAINRAKNGI